MTRPWRYLAFLLVGNAACSFEVDTEGDKGQVRFSRGCGLLGCPVDAPLAAGAIMDVSVRANDDPLPPLTVESGDDRVLTVGRATRHCVASFCAKSSSTASCSEDIPMDDTCADNATAERGTLLVRGVGEGRTPLILRSLNGDVFDQVSLDVHEVERLRVGCEDMDPPILLHPDESCTLRYGALDKTGRRLVVGSSLSFRVNDVAVAGFEGWFGVSSTTTSGGGFGGGPQLKGFETGTTELEVSLGDLSVTMPVRVDED